MATALTLEDARKCLIAGEALSALCVDAARKLTEGGRKLDDHQVLTQRVAYAHTEIAAARALFEHAGAASPNQSGLGTLAQIVIAATGELVGNALQRLDPVADDLNLRSGETVDAETRALVRAAAHESRFREIGRWIGEDPKSNVVVLDDTHKEIRRAVRAFAEKEVAPHAEAIHRDDLNIPESFIAKFSELGYFGLSVPEQYGGHEMGSLGMVLTTEELSRASLAAAGSLITRPEILAKALLNGGTDDQKSLWLPQMASGDVMVAISVTEPNVGSDVASITCRAEPAEVESERGYVINGTKAWCTFAARADVIGLLARTDPDPAKGAKGLSLFIVPKDSFDGREFEIMQPNGGRLSGTSDPTLGYRGMHSFSLSFEDYFVPADHLVGGEEGVGRGFYMQMAGFAAGRLQTSGRAVGLAQAALEVTAEYATQRSQFGKPIIEFQLTQYKLGRMVAQLAAARAFSYSVALAMDEDERKAAPLAAQAKLFGCDVAVELTQEGQLLHGGWGYAEEYAISRYVVDALVLPIFEGVKPTLELKVVGRALLAG
jgi:(2S)-methylsuccinyl-CoA dehydrogenase